MTYWEQPVESAATDSGFEDRGSQILKIFGSVVLFRGECNMYTNPCQQLRKLPTARCLLLLYKAAAVIPLNPARPRSV